MVRVIDFKSTYTLKLTDQQEVIVTVELLDSDHPVDWITLLGMDYTKIAQCISEACFDQIISSEGYTAVFDGSDINVFDDSDINIHITIKSNEDE